MSYSTIRACKDKSLSPLESIIVIGAGMAGIKLAHVLLQHKPDMKITILEANDYIGGRIRSLNFQGHTVEMGANWISGLETKYRNPVWDLAKKVKLSGHFVDRGEERAAQVVDSQGKDIQKEYFEAKKRFEEAYENAVQKCAQQGIQAQNDIDVRSFLEQCGWPSESDLTMIERHVEFNLLEVWVTDSLSRLSVAYNMEEGANDVDLGKEEFFVEDSRGFNCILHAMVEDLRNKGAIIKLNTEVHEVCYIPGHVAVSAKDRHSAVVSEHAASAVVSTVSLGVLHSNAIKFSPPLPPWKTRALDEVGMFIFSKVYVKFDSDFWSEKENQIVVCSSEKGHYPLWMRYRNPPDNKNLFMCYLGGPEAKRVESLTREEIKDEIEALFRRVFSNNLKKGEDPAKVFRPSVVEVTDWSRNRHFCGSYSVFPVHAFSSMPIEHLTRGLTGTETNEGPTTLFFAGEGFDDKYNGWVQGAFRSGERVANCILGFD